MDIGTTALIPDTDSILSGIFQLGIGYHQLVAAAIDRNLKPAKALDLFITQLIKEYL